MDIGEVRDRYSCASPCMAKIMRAAGREPPAQPAQKRRQHCTFCKNHGITRRKNGHVCEHKDCDCLLCQLTTKAQVAMRHQQALWRHQGREMAKNKNFPMLGVSSRQLCDKCRNHNQFFKKRGHKSECRFEKCTCPLCELTDKRRLVMKHQQRVRRANVTSRAISSDEDDDDDNKGTCRQDDQGPRNDRESDDQQEIVYEEGTSEHAIAGVIKQVNEAIEALPRHMGPFSSTGTGPRRSKQISGIPAALKRRPLKAEFSPPLESHSQDTPVSMPQYAPKDVLKPETVAHSSPRRPELGPRPWDCDKESPPTTPFRNTLPSTPSYTASNYSTRTPTPNKASPPVFEAKTTIKQEIKDEDSWPNVVSGEQNHLGHSFVPPHPPGSMLLPHSSYINNMSFYPLASQAEETRGASPPMFSPPRGGGVPPIFNSPRSLYRKSPRTDYMMSKAFDSCKIHTMDDLRNNAHHFESDISAMGRSDYMYGKLLSRGSLDPSNNLSSGDGASALPHFAPHNALEGLSFFTKMKLQRQFPEHYARGPDPPYSTHHSTANHPPIPPSLAAPSQTAMDTAAALHNPIQPCPVRWLPPLSFLPYQSPFSLMQSDPFLRYSPMLFPRANRNT